MSENNTNNGHDDNNQRFNKNTIDLDTSKYPEAHLLERANRIEAEQQKTSTNNTNDHVAENTPTPLPNNVDSLEAMDIPEDSKDVVSLAHIQTYGFKRVSHISKMARQDAVFIPYFKEEKRIPEPSSTAPKDTDLFQYKKFAYHRIFTDDERQIRNLSAEIDNLGKIDQQTNAWTDEAGVFHPAPMHKNDPEITHLSDEEFYNIPALINEKKALRNKLVLECVFGLTENYLKNVEANGLQLAIDAAVYRIVNGVVPESKNSVYS